MATFTKLALSGSTNGRGIAVAATATLGTTIHTAHATALDEVWLYAANIDSSAVTLTVEFGGATTTSDLIQQEIGATPSGLVLVCAGLLVTGSVVVTAFAGTGNKIELFGFVNRIA
jgi:predicted deacylase